VGLRVSHHVQVETNYVSQCLMPGDTAVIVFAKLPLPGLVKTRLARSVGANAAARFYSACAGHITLEAAAGQVCSYVLFVNMQCCSRRAWSSTAQCAASQSHHRGVCTRQPAEAD